MSTTIYLPCEVFEIEVTVGPQDGLSKLEILALEAVAAGVSAFEDLVYLFHLGMRVTLDLVADLWRRDYLGFDPSTGILFVSDRVKECLDAEGRLRTNGFLGVDGRPVEPLHAVYREVRRISLQQELLSAHVLRVRRPPKIVEPVRIAPTALTAGSLRRASRQEIIEVLDRILSQDHRPNDRKPGTDVLTSREQRVLAIGFPSDPARPEEVPLTRVLIDVRVDVHVDPVTDALNLRLLDPSLPRRICVDIERALKNLAEDNPDHAFFRSLRQIAETADVNGVPELSQALQALQGSVALLTTTNAGSAAEHHDTLRMQASDVQSMGHDHVRGHARLRIRTLAQDIQDEVVLAIQQARTQLLLCAPDVGYHALQTLQLHLTEAMARGVRVFLVWGQREASRLDQDVVNRLEGLKKDHGDRLVYSLEPARTGACFLVRDADLVVLSSHNFLRRPAGAFRELAVVTESDRSNEPLHAALEVLNYGRAGYPSSIITVNMATQAADFYRLGYVEPKEPPLEPPKRPSTASAAASFSTTALQLWKSDWTRHVEELTQWVQAAGVTGRMIRDREHRDLLWGMLRRAGRRLVVFSRWIETVVVNKAMMDLLEQRLAAGTHVVIGFHRANGGLRAELDALALRHPGRLQLLVPDGPQPVSLGNIELVIGDDLAVVSSFLFLSSSGYYDGRRRTRSEVGLLLSGEDAADRVLADLSAGIPALAPLLRTAQAAERPAIVPAAVPQTPPVAGLQDLLARLVDRHGATVTRPEGARRLRQYFEALPDDAAAGAALDALANAGMPDVPLVAACCLATHAWDDPGVRHGLQTLIRYSWYDRGDPFPALILLPFVAEPTSDLPPMWVVKLWIARRHSGRLQDQLEATTDKLDESSHAACHAGIALAALMIDGLASAADVLDVARDSYPAPLAAWADAALFYHATTGGRPLPLGRLRTRFHQQRGREEIQTAYAQAQQAIHVARGAQFRFPLGQHTWDFLFGPTGDMGHLTRHVEQADPLKARKWLAEHRGVDDMLDRATEAIWKGDYRDRRIFAPKRTPLIGRLRMAVDRTSDWVERHAAFIQTDGEASLPVGAGELVQRLQQGLPEVEELLRAANRDRRPEAPIVAALLAELGPLVEVMR